MKYLVYLFSLTLMSCATNSSFKAKHTSFEHLKEKTIWFTLTEESDTIKVVRKGNYLGNTKDPNNRAVFEETVYDLAKKMRLDLRFTSDIKKIECENCIVETHIDSLRWIFTFSSANMQSAVNYEFGDAKIPVVAEYKSMGGTKSSNLYFSLRRANIYLLNELEKMKE